MCSYQANKFSIQCDSFEHTLEQKEVNGYYSSTLFGQRTSYRTGLWLGEPPPVVINSFHSVFYKYCSRRWTSLSKHASLELWI